jgi:hypothetical protein
LKRKLLLLNLALVALVALAGWRARQAWVEADRRERAVLRAPLKPLPAPPFASLPAVEPLTATAYEDVAQKMLFSPDRNPTVVIEPAKPKPMPPLPVAYGVLNLGDGPTAVLSEKARSPHRAFHPGETIGEFKLLAVSTEELAFEWEGKKIVKKVEELRERPASEGGPSASETASRAPRPPPAPVPALTQVTPERPLGPGESAGGGIRVCQAGDNTPAGAVVQGMRKVVSSTPFGKVCRWEPVQ